MSDFIFLDIPGDLTTRQAEGNYTFEAPFRAMGNTEDCILRQKMYVLKSDYEGTKPAIGDAHPDEAAFGFCYDEGFVDIGGTVWEFTAVYAKVPTNFSRTGGKYPYLFPAFVTGLGTTDRHAKTLTVALRTQYDFARTNNPLVDLSVVKAQRYVLAANADVDAVNGSEPAVVSDTLPGVNFTVPSYQDYKGWIANGTEIVPEAAAPEVWMGNIYWRRTLYIPAT